LLQRRHNEVPWTLRQTIIGLVITLVIFLSALSGLDMLSRPSPPPKVVSPQSDIARAIGALILGVFSEGIFLLVPFALAYHSKRQPHTEQSRPLHAVFDILGFRGFSLRQALTLVGTFFLALLALNILYSQIINIFHLPIQTNDQIVLNQGRAYPITTYVILAIAILLAPICEETFFRSFLFTGLQRGIPILIAILISALIFAFVHYDLASSPILFLIGIALAIIRWRTQSIWPCILLHTLNNGTSALLIILTLHGMPM
jgi:membrane protease YdiL (CAAX protease family)